MLPLVLLISLILGPLNEEFGWRGYALDKLLVRFGFLGASTILGFMYIPSVMMLSVGVTFVYIKTKRSILAGALVHMFSNLAGSQLLSSYTTEISVLIRYINVAFFAVILCYTCFSKKFKNEVEEQILLIQKEEEA